MYAGTDIATAVAEVFQATRRVDVVTGAPRLTAFTPVRDLALLDLTGTWPIRNGAASALMSAPRSTCRGWARAICRTWPDLDGLHTTSTMTGAATIVLFRPGCTAIGAAPDLSLQLTEPRVWVQLLATADQLGYAM